MRVSEALVHEGMERFAGLADAYRADTSLAGHCETDPVAALREHGIDIPHGSDVRIVPNTDETHHAVLPQDPNGVLEDEGLGAVVGGSTASILSSLSSIPSCADSLGCVDHGARDRH